MLRLKRVLSTTPRNVCSSAFSLKKEEHILFPVIPFNAPAQWNCNRFLDIYQMGNKKEIEKERARIKDEMNRGYFADMAEFKQHGGKIAEANKVVIPGMAAVKFPTFEVNYSDGSRLKLPITSFGNDVKESKSVIPKASLLIESKSVIPKASLLIESKSVIPKASLLCLSFRASSQPMVDSWSSPFLDAFRQSSDVQLYEISFIDSWLLNLSPIKTLLLKIMRKPKRGEENNVLQRQIVYSFGDHYYFRKELKILNLLTGHIFLLDKLGRIRWQGFGSATPDELSSLLSCTSTLLKE